MMWRTGPTCAATHLLMVADFLGVMAWVMIAVGGLGLASTMSLAVLERTREIGVMRAIGARHGAIHLIIQVEGLVIALGVPVAGDAGDAGDYGLSSGL